MATEQQHPFFRSGSPFYVGSDPQVDCPHPALCSFGSARCSELTPNCQSTAGVQAQTWRKLLTELGLEWWIG